MIVLLAAALIVSLLTRPSGQSTAAAHTTAGSLLFQSTFKQSENWATGTLNPNASATLVPDGYRVTSKGNVRNPLIGPFRKLYPAILVTTTATAFPRTNVSFGAACQSSLDNYWIYQFVTYPNGDWYLEKVMPNGHLAIQRQGTGPHLGTTATASLSCVNVGESGGALHTRLTGYVNDRRQVQFTAQQAGLSTNGWLPVLIQGSYGPSVSTTFTSMSVRKLAS